jgi:hypothetical protein
MYPEYELIAAIKSISPPIQPTKYLYTGKNGNDTSGNGSAGKPYLTIQAAISAASSGTTIFIFPGTYIENLTMKAGVNLVAPSKYSVYVRGTITMNITGTVYVEKIVFQSSSGYVLDFAGTTVQNFQSLMCNFESLSGGGDAINYSNTNSSSKISITDGNVTVYISTSAKALNCVAGCAGSFIAAGVTFQLIDTAANVCIYLGGAIVFTHTMDVIKGQVVTADTARATISMVSVEANGIPVFVHNSVNVTPSVFSSIVINTTSSPVITGIGAIAYFAIGYANTGTGGASTLNGGLGPIPFDMGSIKLRSASLLPAETVAAGYANGIFEFDGTHLYFTIGTTRNEIV